MDPEDEFLADFFRRFLDGFTHAADVPAGHEAGPAGRHRLGTVLFNIAGHLPEHLHTERIWPRPVHLRWRCHFRSLLPDRPSFFILQEP